MPTSQGFREAFGKRTKGPAGWEPEGNLDTSAWVLSGRRAAQNRQDRHWTSSDDQAASSKGPPFTEPQISP